jgi:hypothetical protein
MSNPPTNWLPPEFSNATNPGAKLLWMLLLLVVRDKFGRLTFSQKGKSQIVVKMGAFKMVPAPRHLFPAFVKLARRIGHDNRSLDWSYTERKRTRRLKFMVDYANGDPAVQINAAMIKLLQIEEAKRQARRADLRSRCTIAALIWLVFFLLILVIVIQAFG